MRKKTIFDLWWSKTKCLFFCPIGNQGYCLSYSNAKCRKHILAYIYFNTFFIVYTVWTMPMYQSGSIALLQAMCRHKVRVIKGQEPWKGFKYARVCAFSHLRVLNFFSTRVWMCMNVCIWVTECLYKLEGGEVKRSRTNAVFCFFCCREQNASVTFLLVIRSVIPLGGSQI